jgi:hypothetical protein
LSSVKTDLLKIETKIKFCYRQKGTDRRNDLWKAPTNEFSRRRINQTQIDFNLEVSNLEEGPKISQTAPNCNS